MEDLPSVDELVVLTLRAENIASDGGNKPTVARNYRVLRQISLEYPALTRAVWRLLGSEPHRRWDASVRAKHPDARARGQGAAYRAGAPRR
jgi:hypothetical protein